MKGNIIACGGVLIYVLALGFSVIFFKEIDHQSAQDYTVVTHIQGVHTDVLFIDLVNDKIKEGYDPLGGISITVIANKLTINQAMVK